ncbi:hypothetical protein RJT34_22611 [Clitoria ternatea]|uniref:Uncharacterized protein n=1 Tax=Clitoria ternatea TaxID=43366 RepID=A0AAN9FLR2_CLITE
METVWLREVVDFVQQKARGKDKEQIGNFGLFKGNYDKNEMTWDKTATCNSYLEEWVTCRGLNRVLLRPVSVQQATLWLQVNCRNYPRLSREPRDADPFASRVTIVAWAIGEI